MHPVERIRALARASWLDPRTVAIEGADAIADATRWMDDAAAVSIARRLLAWHGLAGPLWYAAGRVLTALDAEEAAAHVVAELQADPTVTLLDAALPADAEPYLVGDLGLDTGVHYGMGSRRTPGDLDAAVRRAGHVIVTATAIGPAFDGGRGAEPVEAGAIVPAVGAAAIDAARRNGVGVWIVGGVGVVVDGPLWARLVPLAASGRPRPVARTSVWWDEGDADGTDAAVVGFDGVAFIAGPDGLCTPADAVTDAPTTPVDLLDAAGADPF